MCIRDRSHNHRIFWQHGGQTVHLGTVGLDRTGDAGELAGCVLHKHLRHWPLGNQRNNRSGEFIHFRRITLFEKVAVTFTPFAVTLGKSIQAVLADAVSVPEGVDEIHPFLRTILAYRTVKAFANPGE